MDIWQPDPCASWASHFNFIPCFSLKINLLFWSGFLFDFGAYIARSAMITLVRPGLVKRPGFAVWIPVYSRIIQWCWGQFFTTTLANSAFLEHALCTGVLFWKHVCSSSLRWGTSHKNIQDILYKCVLATLWQTFVKEAHNDGQASRNPWPYSVLLSIVALVST